MMEPPQYDVDELLIKFDYFQRYLEDLLALFQPSFYCFDWAVRVLLDGPEGSGKRLLVKTAAKKLGMSFYEERVSDLFDENIVGTEKKIRSSIAKAATSTPCVLYFTGYELFCKLEDNDIDHLAQCIHESLEELVANNNKQPVVFIGATNDFHQVFKTPLSVMFQHNISISPPSITQATEILENLTQELNIKSNPTRLLDKSSHHEYFIGNLINLISQAEREFYHSNNMKPDFIRELSTSKDETGVRWTDVGGLSEIKQEIIDAIQLYIDFPQLKESGLRRTGILLHGPPGTGKTLLAKAVATECSLNFLNVKGPELLNQYVGQSEDNVRKLFHKARESSPSVIFFDEFDSLAPNRGQSGDSGGVMDRMVSQILAEMDGIGKGNNVFVIAATNRVDLVDPSLLRPGRFDKVLEVPLPKGKVHRIQILEALTRKMLLSDDVDIQKIEELARPEISGADFQDLCSKALQRTFDRCVEDVESSKSTEEDVEIMTCMADFLYSLGK